VLLVQELQRRCAVAAGHHALHWDHLNRAGRPRDAEDAARWAHALDRMPEPGRRCSVCDAERQAGSSPAPSLQRLALAPLRPHQFVHCGQDAHPGPPPGLVAGCLQLVGAQGGLQLGIVPVPVKQQFGAPVGIKTNQSLAPSGPAPQPLPRRTAARSALPPA